MKTFSAEAIQSWERFYRGNFINSLSGFKSASLIGTINSKGQTNLGIFSNIVHIGADPALIGYINRPPEAAPHTIANIQETKVYTINHIHPQIIAAAHQTSAKYPEGVSEFQQAGLTEEFMPGIAAPFVKESRVKYALELQEIIPITLNNTFLVIGKVQQVILHDNILQPDGFLELTLSESICSSGIDGYYRTQFIDRYEYAKPNKPPRKLGEEI